jgi:hypothetical protein
MVFVRETQFCFCKVGTDFLYSVISTRVHSRSSLLQSVVDKMALRWPLLRLIAFTPVSIIENCEGGVKREESLDGRTQGKKSFYF